jgi:hypothetical protein
MSEKLATSRSRKSTRSVASESNSVAFSYQGRDVLCDAHGLISLTSMWHAAGRPEGKNPDQWSRHEGADFIAFIETYLKLARGRIFKRRREAETFVVWAHPQIAIAYAKQLSNEFHAFVNQGFLEWADETRNPALKVDRAIENYRRRGRDELWIETRLQGVAQRRALASAMQRHDCQSTRTLNPFAEGTRAITFELFGLTPRELRASRGVGKSANTRDLLSRIELARLQFAETEAANLIESREAHGNEQCIQACRDAGIAVRDAIATLHHREKR